MPTPRLTNRAVFSLRGVAGEDRKLAARQRSDPRDDDLPAVRVAGQHQLHVERGRLLQSPRIMREQNGGAARAFQHTSDFSRAARPESNAREIEPLAVDRQRGALIFQHAEAARRQRRGHFALIVVIAEHRERSVRGVRQRREQLRHRRGIGAIEDRDVVAAKDDDVGSGLLEER